MNKLNQNKLLGLAFIVVGTIAVLSNFDLIPGQVRHYLFQWENLLLITGAYLLITEQNKKAGAILLIIGFVLVIDDWLRVDISIWELWPLILVFAGIHLIRRTIQKPGVSEPVVETPDMGGDTVDDMAVFSGGDKIVSTKNFSGGSLTAIFGGSNIDLTSCNMQRELAEIDIFYMFGGSRIRVPKGWQVDIRATNIFGGLSDKRILTEMNSGSQKKLIIKGLVLFGGAEISN